ncbi:Ribosomal protein S18 [Elusimicrobium minutum Pei191]|uniref:Small ribosomal subunit protein bS18 n=1 Tax=Elusimicrobium minutum (strain Pei191) TaxID=445932 RepID=RS18_ELUMP|nr:30S ribosomal protein S18 [Elusimicrobium minutum]B2KEG0.1 RecName: Full=Small ribosomal subunit protein bS18; AltName: Full=30S ribosomal protein S18 [Elusimicrobium minutum Pei191]ACC98906.1 Ribosomal protein S18 [Elusimicrobium minutum Pei191]
MSEEKIVNTEAAPEAVAERPARAERSERPERPAKGPFGKKRFESRRKVCKLCAEKIENVDYKNFQFIKSFTMDSGKILSRRITGTCAKHQRQIASAVKRDRNLAILPYSLPKK